MASLTIKNNNKIINQLQLTEDKSYIAGRKEGADIFIDAEKAVSREHFVLKHNNGQWELEVISRFGEVILDGEKVRNISFDKDTVFSIPPYEFIFKNETDANPEDFEKTTIGKINYNPCIHFLDNNHILKKNIILPNQESWMAGRDSSCDILIEDQRVSRRQFKIFKENEQYYILDLGSVNGTLVNTKTISSENKLLLKSGDRIQVLDNLMRFELKNSDFEQELVQLKEPMVNNSNALVPFNPNQSDAQTNAFTAQTNMTTNSLVQYSSDQVPMPQDFQQQNLNMIDPNQMGYVNNQMMPYSPYVDPNALNYNYQVSQQQDQSPYSNQMDEDDKKKKIRMALIAVVALVVMFVGYNEFMGTGNSKSKKVSQKSDPFQKLNPNEVSLLKQSLEIANDYYYKQSYQLAFDETQKIIKKMDDYGIEYKKTKFGNEVDELSRKSDLALEAQRLLDIEENNKRDAAIKENKINTVMNGCEPKINSNFTMEQFDQCIASIIHDQPNHPRIETARMKIKNFETERMMLLQREKDYNEKVSKLRAIYNKAVQTEKKGELLQAIEVYKSVVRQSLPDPEELKGTSRRKIAAIESMISSKSVKFLQEADKLAGEKKFKDAILSLKQAQKVNPQDSTLEVKIDQYKHELVKELKPLWEEASIEETYGQVECTENKSCAIDKWKKIIQTDVSDGDYYLKANAKLKKYRAR